MNTNNFKLLICLIFLGVLTGCKKDDNSSVNSDEYYVKYVVKSSSSPYMGVKLNTSFTNEFNEVLQSQISTGDWETTIGPVKKGFLADFKVAKSSANGSSVDNYLKITISILVSKNSGPFAQKKYDDNGNRSRILANMQYTVE